VNKPPAHDPEESRQILRDASTDYAWLRKRLVRRLGGQELADEALQEAFLKIERAEFLPVIRDPRQYILKIALNAAADRRRTQSRRLETGEVEAFLNAADPAPSPEQAASDRQEYAALSAALAELPARRRLILIAARVEGVNQSEIARRFGVSTRTIEVELAKAIRHCARKLGREAFQRFGPRPGPASSREEKKQ
jgi:RNA polymerase sigma factor (sigma-70 family)